MRRAFQRFYLAVILLTALPAGAEDSARRGTLTAFCASHSLNCEELIYAISGIQKTGKLPEKWITKNQARELGWHPGKNLGKVAPGKSIGGDRFGNRERKLPVKKGRGYTEADLDYKGGRRNAKRLIFSNDGLMFVSTDHYRSFDRVPQ